MFIVLSNPHNVHDWVRAVVVGPITTVSSNNDVLLASAAAASSRRLLAGLKANRPVNFLPASGGGATEAVDKERPFMSSACSRCMEPTNATIIWDYLNQRASIHDSHAPRRLRGNSP